VPKASTTVAAPQTKYGVRATNATGAGHADDHQKACAATNSVMSVSRSAPTAARTRSTRTRSARPTTDRQTAGEVASRPPRDDHRTSATSSVPVRAWGSDRINAAVSPITTPAAAQADRRRGERPRAARTQP
jgi:hypothetical protein